MTKEKRKKLLLEFEQYLSDCGYEFTKEAVFKDIMPTKRRFRADYFIPPCHIVEINGGQWTQGRHTRGGKGYENDLTKLNIAANNMFYVYQFTYEMLERQEYKKYI